ncbi:MAG: FAD-dependent oxidoreductase [Deltaproteobacteria bacterium]|nr:FAD-dependent oxidoreductase [Deltaproteobacteria bacterium]
MADVETCEVLIVGGGKAGKTLAADLARSGHDVVLVERGMIGGTCINVGCIPTKALVASARVATLVARGEEFGIRVDQWAAEMPAVVAHKRAVVDGMVALNWDTLHGALGDRLLLGEARFVGPRTAEVRMATGGAVRRIRGDKLFINLGAEPSLPSLPGLREAAPLTSRSALELERLPEHLLIMGGGYIGAELGQAFRRFGSRATIIQRAAHLLPAEDTDISEAIESIFRADGIALALGSEVASVEGRSGEGVRVDVRSGAGARTIEASDLLVAVGRVPCTRDVGLDEAGVALDARGFIVVNDRLETTAPNTWAMADSAGSPQQTHVALDDYRIVKSNVFGGGARRTTDRLIPHTVFIDPELGRVGLTERAARQQGLAIRVASVPASVVPRARTLTETRGLLKAVVDASSSRVLGFAMLGAEAGEVAAVVQMAMLGRLPFTALRDGVLAHPTMAEGLNYLFAAPMR